MKIGIDGRLWNETGVGRYIRALVKNLSQLDKKHTYVLFLKGEEFETLELLSSRWTKVLSDVSWHSVAEQILMPKFYAQANLDLLHIPYFSVPLFTPGPFIVTIHDLTISHFATGQATTKPLPIYRLKRLGYNLVLSSAVKRAAAIITVSNTVKQQLIDEFSINKKKIFVTHESGSLEDSEKESERPLTEAYILYVGNAHPHKNVFTLIEAYSLLREKLPQIKLVLIGTLDFFYLRLREKVHKLRLDDHILFLGHVAQEDLAAWYRSALCFVFPSLSEGFGIPGLEAMNQACPVLASDIPVFHEIYQAAAVYFDPLHASRLSMELKNICTNQLLRRKLIYAGKKQAKKYSWERMTRETATIYENSIGVRSRE